MSKEQELKEMLKLYSKQDLWNRIQEKQAMIYDLETKLAEKDNTISTLIADNEASKELLKKQLAEKDKEIADLQSQLAITEKALELACYNHIMQVFDKDKININEKVKEYILFYMEKAKELKGNVEE